MTEAAELPGFLDRVAALQDLAAKQPDQVRIWLQRHPRNLMIYCGFEPQWFHDEGFDLFFRSPRSLWLAPRGSGKSTIAVFVAAWLGLADPAHWAPELRGLFKAAPRHISPKNIRIALTSNSHAKACALLWQVKAILTGREVSRLFGPLAGATWKDEMAATRMRDSILREPTYTALGLGSKVTGGHYDVVIADDWVTEDNARTELQRGRLEDFWAFTVKGTCEPWCRVGVYGTRYHPKDFYGKIYGWATGKEDERNANRAPRWQVLRHPAVMYSDGGVRFSYWPLYYTLEYLDETKEEIGPVAFSTQYQNEVEGMLGDFFDAEWLEQQSIPWADRPDTTRSAAITGMALDPAFKGGPRNDWSAFTILHAIRRAQTPLFHFEVCKRGKWTMEGLVKTSEALYKTHKPSYFAVEAIQGAEWLIQALRKSKRIPRGLVKAMPPRINKVGRADKVRAYYENGWVHFDPPNHDNGLDVLIDEHLAFTGEKGGKDDTVDSAVWNLITMSRGRTRLGRRARR